MDPLVDSTYAFWTVHYPGDLENIDQNRCLSRCLMDFDDAEKIIDKARTQPIKVLLIVVVIVLFTILIAYITTFTSKKAEQHAATTPPAPQMQPKINGPVEQRTEGNQSPAIKTDEGDVTIKYGETK
jgi:hypothetical protein